MGVQYVVYLKIKSLITCVSIMHADHYSSGIRITDEGVVICAEVTDDVVPVETNTLEVAFDVEPDGSPSVKCHVVVEGREDVTGIGTLNFGCLFSIGDSIGAMIFEERQRSC